MNQLLAFFLIVSSLLAIWGIAFSPLPLISRILFVGLIVFIFRSLLY